MSTPISKWIDARLFEAHERAFQKIWDYQRSGQCTLEEIRQALYLGWGDDVVDMWDEWLGDELE